MKKLYIFYLLLICIVLTSCGKVNSIKDTNYFSNYEAKSEGNRLSVSGRVHIADSINVIYINSKRDTQVNLTGTFNKVSGDFQIMYVTSDNEEVIVDSKDKRTLQIDSDIKISEGIGYIIFKGKNMNLNFELLFSDIKEDDFNYFSNSSPSEETSVSNEEKDLNDETKSQMSLKTNTLLADFTIAYTNDDTFISNTLINTELDESTNVKIVLKINISNINDEKMILGDFKLKYKSDDGSETPILEINKKEVAFGGYASENNYEKDIYLNKGENNLMLSKVNGENFKIDFDVKIYKIE